MEEFLLYVVKNHGLEGVLLLVLFWLHVVLPQKKKKDGKWIDIKDVRRNTSDINNVIMKLEKLELKQATSEVVIASIQTKQIEETKLRDEQSNIIYIRLDNISSQIESLHQNLLILSREMRQRNDH